MVPTPSALARPLTCFLNSFAPTLDFSFFICKMKDLDQKIIQAIFHLPEKLVILHLWGNCGSRDYLSHSQRCITKAGFPLSTVPAAPSCSSQHDLPFPSVSAASVLQAGGRPSPFISIWPWVSAKNRSPMNRMIISRGDRDVLFTHCIAESNYSASHKRTNFM
jgi:hypothetical protein